MALGMNPPRRNSRNANLAHVSDGKLNRDTLPISANRVRQALRSPAITEAETVALQVSPTPSASPQVTSPNGAPHEEIALTVVQPERYVHVEELGRGGMGRVD